MGKVKNTFLPHEAELILSIPISARLPEDSYGHGPQMEDSQLIVHTTWPKKC